MEQVLTSADVAKMLEIAISKLPWIDEVEGVPFPEYDVVGIDAIGTGHLVNLCIRRDLQGRFVIKHFCDEIVDVTFNTEEDVKAFFEKEILPLPKHKYYNDVASLLIRKVSGVLEESGKEIFHTQRLAKVGKKVTLQSFTFGNNAITFSYAKNGDIQVFEYRLNYDVVIYTADELSQDLDDIEEKLMGLARELVESFVEVED